MSFFNDASIVQIPSGYKASTLYSIKPSSGAGDFSVTRNTTATRVNENGLIESVAANVPRIDYLNGDCGELLVEPQRTNLEDNSNTSTGYILTRITRGSSTSRKGIDGFLYSDDGSGMPNLLNNSVSFSSGDYVFSVFIDATNSNSFQINLSTDGNASNGVFATFTPSTESFSAITENTTQVTASSGFVGYESFGDNVYRIWIGANFKTGSTTFTPIVYIGTGNSNVFIGGWQLEAGSYKTSYIETSGSTVTRNADVISKTSIASLLGDSEGALFVEASAFDGSSSNRLSLSDGTLNNRVNIAFASAGVSSFVVIGGVSQYADTAGTVADNTFYKIGLRYALNNFATYQNGLSISTDSSGSVFSGGTLTTLRFTAGDSSTTPFYGRIRQLVVFDQALLDEELSSIAAYASFTEIANANNYTING